MAPAKDQQVVFHPILLAIYPIVFLYASNREALDFSVLFGPLFVNIVVVSLLWWLLHWRVRSVKLSALYTSVIVLGFYSFGAVHEIFDRWSLEQGFVNVSIAAKLVGACLLVVLICAGLWLTLRKHVGTVTYVVNIVSTVLVCAPMGEIAVGTYQTFVLGDLIPDRTEFEAIPLAMQSAENRPDIYYIVLDGYGREDLLAEEYAHDNSAFLDSLREQGFYVASRSRANYPWTLGSLASSLNFAYLNEPLGEDLRPYENKVFLRELLQGNRAMRHLRAAGYRTIVYESQYYEIDLREADRTVGESWAPRPFSVVILQMTPIPALLRRVGIPLFYDLHRARLLSTLAGLPDVTREPSPKFVFAHLMYAHTPLVLDAAGGNVTPQGNYSWTTPVGKGDKQFMEAYRGQLSYLNTKLETVVRRIIAESARPPVIMLQGDHGPEMGLSRGSLSESDVDGRYSIFNAYLFPEGGEEKLYDSISPVNSFRILFNHYFGTSYPLLEDKSYYTTDRLIYDFQPIPEDRFEPR